MDIIESLLQGSKVLEDFVEHIKSDSNSSLPPDGTVYQLTCDVLFFLEQLLDYIDIIGIVLAQDSAYSNALTNIPQDAKKGLVDKNKTLLGIYISNLIFIFHVCFHCVKHGSLFLLSFQKKFCHN